MASRPLFFLFRVLHSSAAPACLSTLEEDLGCPSSMVRVSDVTFCRQQRVRGCCLWLEAVRKTQLVKVLDARK